MYSDWRSLKLRYYFLGKYLSSLTPYFR
jgi:hypothetical protein